MIGTHETGNTNGNADRSTDTITFLFTDIEGSTKLWERHPAEMGGAVARHDALIRAAIERSGGSVFKTLGDGFCSAFQTASAALSAALELQRTLASEAWPPRVNIKVRAALHTGVVEVRDSDFYGQPLNRVARLLSAGHGGQVLLSRATQELVRDGLPAGIELRDMGERWLKDLIRPEHVFQLIGADLADGFPPLRTLDARLHNLPIQPTSFVGREAEMDEVRNLLSSGKLVTLTGAGGAGKTRLALQVAAERIDDYADGTWLVELASVSDPSLVPQAVATALAIKEQPATMLTDTLLTKLADKELLLLLDNCEHLIDACARLCQTLLGGCSGLRILATSREALRIPGEALYRLPSLNTPDPSGALSISTLTQYSAVKLFIDRALAVRPAFQVTNQSAPALASICHKLDGIPLAIELAAARVRSLSVQEINQRLDERFSLLTGGSRTALPRQQTLRAAIDWSYQHLGAGEQALLSCLSVFAGGCALDSAERVCPEGGAILKTEVADLLTSLADKSLVLADERGGSTRYRLLETVRQYARDRLEESGAAQRVRAAHLDHFVALAEEAEPRLTGADQQTWLDRLETEHDNLRAALAWAVRHTLGADGGLRLAGALWWFWQVRGYPGEGRKNLAALLEAPSEARDSASRAKALNAGGMLAWLQGEYGNASKSIRQCLAIRRRLGDPSGVARALSNLGVIARDQGDHANARALQEESLSLRRELGDRWGMAALLANLGLVVQDLGDYGSARRCHEECVGIFRELDDQRNIGGALTNLGELAIAQGDRRSALKYYEEALAIFRRLGDRRGISITLTGMGQLAADREDLADAEMLLGESLTLKVELGDRRGIAISLESIAYVKSTHGDVELAARLWGRAEQLRREIEAPLAANEVSEYERQVAAACRALGDDAAFDRLWREGAAMSIDRAVGRALGAAIPQDA